MITWYFLPVLFISWQCVTAQLSLDDLTSALENIPEDGQLEFCDLVRKHNYPCDRYEVTTEDGYIITLFNIPGNTDKVVFMQHGFLDSSYAWFMRGPDSPAAMLANNSYDVWLGNTRGNLLSRNHVTLNPDLLKFWEFSLDEMALYDLPSMIDFILKNTGQTQLQAVAHSQGTTLFYVLGSLKPEYSSKIKHVLCLAPVARLDHSQQPFFPLVALAGGPILSGAVGFLGHGEFLSNSSVLASLIQIACAQGLVGYTACGVVVAGVLFGSDPEQFEPEFARKVLGYYPAGSSLKNAVHLLQIVATKRFQQYDYGLVGNLGKYNSAKPPLYDLNKVGFNVSLYVGKNDRFSAIEDAEYLREQLNHVIEYRIMEYEKWNHIDFIWGKYMDDYLFKPMLESLENFNCKLIKDN